MPSLPQLNPPASTPAAALPAVDGAVGAGPVGAVERSRIGHLATGPWLVAVRVGLDAVALITAVVIAQYVGGVSLIGPAWPLLLFSPAALAALALRQTYQRRMRTLFLDTVGPVSGAISLAGMGVFVVASLMEAVMNVRVIVLAWALGLVFVATSRLAGTLFEHWARVTGRAARPTLIVGAGVVGGQVARRLLDAPEYGLVPVGYLDADALSAADVGGRPVPVLGGPSDLERVVAECGATTVVFAFSKVSDHELRTTLEDAERLGLEVSLVPRMFEAMNDRVVHEPVGGLPLLGLRRTKPRGWQFALKHAQDRLFAGALLVILAPTLLAIAAGVRVSSPGPVLFRQRRVGRDGRSFDLLKFRSMMFEAPEASSFRPTTDAAPGGVEGGDRRTSIGRLLRRTSLDELPQLVNVLRGEMSLVGPRPERPEFVELFTNDLRRYQDRHRVKSGMTGWAQIHGLRGKTSLAERVEMDNYYIEHWSLTLDWKIVARTVIALARGAE